MSCGQLKMDWILTIFILVWSSQCHGIQHNVTYLTLEGGQPYVEGGQYSGRVVIQLDREGVNGSICSSSWRNNDARVVCKMLGYSRGRTAQSNKFPNGNRNYLMGNLRCTGEEDSISHCPGADHLITCEYGNKEVAVVCDGGSGSTVFGSTGFPFTTQAPVSTTTVQPTLMYSICAGGSEYIRLLGREGTKSMGYVQVYVDDNWQFICDDTWSEKNAQVFCRELFCNSNGSTNICARPAVMSNYLPEIFNPIKIVWYGVQCNGNEKSIFDCYNQRESKKTCTIEELAGVQCEANPLETAPTLEAVLNCKDPSGDMKMTFPSQAFPDLREDNLNVLYKTSGSASCATNALTHYNDSEISITIPIDDCGTRCTSNGTHICYENVVEYRHQVATIVLTESMRKEFTIQCCIPMETNANIHFLPESSFIKNTLAQSYDQQPEVDFCQDETCETPVSASPYPVAVGEWVYVGIKLKAGFKSLFKDLEMATNNCTLDFIGGGLELVESRGLIEDKCPIDAASVTKYNISGDVESFRFKAIKHDSNSIAYVTCHVRVCLPTVTNSTCDRSCEIPTDGRRRRQNKKDINDVNDVVKVVSKYLMFTDVDPKAKDAARKDSSKTPTDDIRKATTDDTRKTTMDGTRKTTMDDTRKTAMEDTRKTTMTDSQADVIDRRYVNPRFFKP